MGGNCARELRMNLFKKRTVKKTRRRGTPVSRLHLLWVCYGGNRRRVGLKANLTAN